MQTIVIISVVLIILFVIAAFMGDKAGKKAGKRARKLLMVIDSKYQDFIEKRITYNILKNESLDLDIETVAEEAMVIIKPDISGLIAHINGTTYSTAEVSYDSVYFRNAVSLTNEFYGKSRENRGKVLTNEDEQEYYGSFKDAIKSDLSKRLLDLKTGNL